MAKKPTYTSSSSSTRPNANYSISIEFGEDRRGVVTLTGKPDEIQPWSKGKSVLKPNTPLDRK